MAVAAEGPTPVLAGKGGDDEFRRYEAFLAWRWRHTHLGARGDAPYVLFICEDDEQRDDFFARADGELTAHLWHPSSTVGQHEYVGAAGSSSATSATPISAGHMLAAWRPIRLGIPRGAAITPRCAV